MKLRGFSYLLDEAIDPDYDFSESYLEGPRIRNSLHKGFVDLGDFTGVVGRNDSGKSQLLSLLEDALQPWDHPEQSDYLRAIFYFSCSAGEFKALTELATLDLVEFDREIYSLEEAPLSGMRNSCWGLNLPFDYRSLDNANLDKELDVVTQYRELLLDSFQDDKGPLSRLLEASIAGSSVQSPDSTHIVAFSWVKGAWALYWCAPFDGNEASSLHRDYLEYKRQNKARHGRFFLGNVRGFIGRIASGTDRFGHIAPVGRIDLPLLPRPIRPVNVKAVTLEAEKVIGALAARVRDLEMLLKEDVEATGIQWDPRLEARIETGYREGAWKRGWLRENGVGGYEVNPDILSLAEKLGVLANDLAPDFFTERYRISVTVRPPDEWEESGRLVISAIFSHEAPPERVNEHGMRVRLIRGPGATEGLGIPIEATAQGYHLWIGLALSEAVRLIEMAGGPLDYSLHDLLDIVQNEYVDVDDSYRLAGEILNEQRWIPDTIEEFFESLPSVEPVDESRGWDRVGKHDRVSAELNRATLFLIDEPERHLHPALQRQAAKLVAEKVARDGFQAIVATHSVPFMSIKSNASYAYLIREPGSETIVSSLEPSSLDLIDATSAELGLDRGELLGLIEAIVWVEGHMDWVVLKSLFDDRFKELGVLLVTLDGHPGARGIINSHLLGFANVKTAVWLDGISTDFFLEAQQNFNLEPTEPNREEKKTLLAVLREAARSEREIKPIHLDRPADDVFDLLDDLAIQSEFPDYPGHAAAQAQWASAVTNGAKKGERKNFWKKKFRTPIDHVSCERIALSMKREGRITPELQSVMDQIEDLVKGP
jgi:hypothetical protein